ncbi:MAG: spore coat protein U domain-containing protein [Rhizobium sp.]
MAVLLQFGLAESTLAASCTVGVDALNFGNVDTLSGPPSNSTAQVSISCNDVAATTTTVTVCGNFGAGSGGSAGNTRTMLSGAKTLNYQLFSDSGRSSPWGAYNNTALGQPQTIQVPASGGAAVGSVTLYGAVAAGQPDAATGTYASTFAAPDASFYYQEGTALNCSAPTAAAVAQTSFAVQATVAANCLLSVNDINFGNHGVINSAVTAVGGVNVTCTPGTQYTIAIDGGLSGATNPEQRLMKSGTNTIAYGLYSDAAHTQPWSATGSGLVTGTSTSGGNMLTIPVYGRVEPQPVAVGQYSDTVVVTITYL